MKSSLILRGFFACIVFMLFLSSKPAVHKSRVEWLTPTSHDFGNIPRDVPVECVFVYKNISSEPLTVDNVRTSCGCTAPEWDTGEVIMPDSTGQIRLVFDAHMPGYFYKLAKVYFSGQRKGEKLIIEGEVVKSK